MHMYKNFYYKGGGGRHSVLKMVGGGGGDDPPVPSPSTLVMPVMGVQLLGNTIQLVKHKISTLSNFLLLK